MDLITVILTLALIGVLLWFLEKYVPMAEPFRLLIRIIVAFAIIFWLLRVFGIGPAIRIPAR